MSDRILPGLALFAMFVLAGAAVWMGALNQDEGWYLYAANLVAEGQMPYADFAYTQGPVMPIVYSAFSVIWRTWGLLGARLFTMTIGLVGVAFAALTARRMAGRGAALVVLFLLGSNLYHLYYLAIPKTYALAALFVAVGFYLLTFLADRRAAVRAGAAILAGAALALAAGTRVSLGALLAAVGVGLLWEGWRSREAAPRVFRWSFLLFGLGGGLVLMLIYGGLLLCPATREGLLAAQRYHAARGGFDPVFFVGSLSRLVRWYLPVFVVLGLGVAGACFREKGASPLRGGVAPSPRLLLGSFLAVFAVQMFAPFPYEDYQVPVMGLLAVYAAVTFEPCDLLTDLTSRESRTAELRLLLVLGLTFASSFGSPLLEKWTTNGQDRFWSIKKEKSELAQLREAAAQIEAIDPGGRDLFTQDLYLAIETDRKVPHGLEMGPFSILTDAEWRRLISSASCPVAAVSGYTFAVEPPKCDERPVEQQMDYLRLLKENYTVVDRRTDFGQNATTLLLLKRKAK